MYTEHIGRRLLRSWQQHTGRTLDVHAFFHQEFVPLFFGEARLLLWPANSPFVQRNTLALAERVAQLDASLVAATAPGGNGLDFSIAPGFAAATALATTSGQVSSGPAQSADTGYYAWLGVACGIGVAGGLSLALGEEEVLWRLWLGWQHYRAALTANPGLKGNQVETWNGQWLLHAYGPAYDAEAPLGGLALAPLLRQAASGAAQEVTPAGWARLLLRLAGSLPDTTAYVYALGQTNTTQGFVTLATGEARRLAAHLAPEAGPYAWEELLASYQPRLRLSEAALTGTLGLLALEPAGLQKALAGGPRAARTPEQERHQYACTRWLTAMLAPEPTSSPTTLPRSPLAEAADQLAQALVRYARHEPGRDKGRGKTKYAQLAQQVLTDSPSTFVRQLSELLRASPAGPAYRGEFMAAVAQTTDISITRFHHFQSLLRFHFEFYSAE